METDLRPNVGRKEITCSICTDGTLEVSDAKCGSVLVVCPSCGIVGHSCEQAYTLHMKGNLPELPITPILGVQFSSRLREDLWAHMCSK